MPVLPDPKHEAYAQALARGLSGDKAYIEAGYKPNRGNASRLKSNENIKARVAELQAATAEKTAKAISWEARDIFERLQGLVDRAAEAGSWKDAIDGQKFIARCFGYEDSPTLTHEHVKGTKIPVHDKPEVDEVEDGRPVGNDANVTRLADAINRLRKRAG